MKKPLIVLVALIGMAVAVFYVSAHAVSRYLARDSSASASTCSGHHATHTVAIRDDKITPAHTSAARCDSLIITNYDAKARLMAFGEHRDHQAYDGVKEQVLHANQSLSITLNQPGTFTFHDHLQDEVEGSFTVADSTAIVK